MISLIQGTLKAIDHASIHVLTDGGIGYELFMPLPSLYQMAVGQKVVLWTALVVRDDAHILCAFLDKAERDTFLVLIKLSGVGLKMALAILSTLTPDELGQVIAGSDESRLTKIAGVGKKTAQRLIIELNGKLGALTSPQGSAATEAELALLSLGYKQKEVNHALKSAQAAGMTTADTIIRAALKSLSIH